ncbi:MAG: biotin synthase BioB [Duncaniella sp.]|nr:biotin synthase BioB [Duncaniella sp.]
MIDIQALKNKILSGGDITDSEVMELAELEPSRLKELWDAAAEITARFSSRKFDSCSIVNARSGKCPEDCKWCAQSARHTTDIALYPLVDHETCTGLADYNRSQGIGRFSMVTSGRRLGGKSLDTLCDYYREIHSKHPGMGLCASMGLLEKEDFDKLYAAGVRRYHCNLETAPSHFPTLCSTHTIADKIKSIRAAAAAGMEICSGGIIGMGETMRQRAEFAVTLREINPISIPVNILQPIPGTPLEGAPALSEEEILTTVAIFRMAHPRIVLRFAGGRARMTRETQLKAMRIGINGAIMGDLLTTIGAQIAQDKELVAEGGYIYES